MTLLLSLLTGIVFGGAIYLLLQRSASRMLLGVLLLLQGCALVLFTTGGLLRDAPPILNAPRTTPASQPTSTAAETGAAQMQLADPLPQLFALDSLLIGLALLTLLLVLTYRAFATAPGDDLNQIDTSTAPEDRT